MLGQWLPFGSRACVLCWSLSAERLWPLFAAESVVLGLE